MFNLFSKKNKEIKVTDTVLISTTAKYQAMFEQWSKNKTIVFIFWFDESIKDAATFFSTATNEEVTLLLARKTILQQLSNRLPIFAEHHPMESKEQDYFKKMKLNSVQVYSGLNEPLYKHFGAEKIINIMRSLGMKENEAIEHSMISASIKKAQKKIAKMVIAEQNAKSQEDWIQKNYTPPNP